MTNIMSTEYGSRVKRDKVKIGGFILCQFLVLGVSVLLALCRFSLDVNPELLTYPLCIWIVILFVWSLVSWYWAYRRLFDPYILFLMSVTVFNAGQAFLEVFHMNKNGLLGGRFSADTIANTLCLVALALASLHLGGFMGYSTSRQKKAKLHPYEKLNFGRHFDVRLVGWVMLMVSVVPFLTEFKRSIDVVMSSGYFGLYQQEKLTGIDSLSGVLAGFFMPGLMFLIAGSRDIPLRRATMTLVVLVYSGLSIFLGLRARGGYTLISYAWLWDRLIAPLPKVLLAISGLILLLVVFPSVRLIRDISAAERLTGGYYILKAFLSLDNPVVIILSELGGSMGVIAHTLELVPSVRAFDMGASYLYALLTVFPNLFWDVHPSISRGTGSDWLVWTVDPVTAAAGGGLGFSVIAEAYLNFGWIGVPLVMGTIGFLVALLVRWMNSSPDPARVALVACILPKIMGLARAETTNVMRSLVWHGLLPYTAVLFVRSLSRRPRLGNTFEGED